MLLYLNLLTPYCRSLKLLLLLIFIFHVKLWGTVEGQSYSKHGKLEVQPVKSGLKPMLLTMRLLILKSGLKQSLTSSSSSSSLESRPTQDESDAQHGNQRESRCCCQGKLGNYGDKLHGCHLLEYWNKRTPVDTVIGIQAASLVDMAEIARELRVYDETYLGNSDP